MWLLTGRELEFLMTLRDNWQQLYHDELVRLLKEDACRSDRVNVVAAHPAVLKIVA